MPEICISKSSWIKTNWSEQTHVTLNLEKHFCLRDPSELCLLVKRWDTGHKAKTYISGLEPAFCKLCFLSLLLIQAQKTGLVFQLSCFFLKCDRRPKQPSKTAPRSSHAHTFAASIKRTGQKVRRKEGREMPDFGSSQRLVL